jgi:hypothetical protein
MNIYTYHAPVDNLPYQYLLLELWQKSWRAAGWNPLILTTEQAQFHPLYESLERHFYASLPTQNSAAYEWSCYARWLAMDFVGGGWMSDSDVINYSFFPIRPDTDTLTIFSQGNLCPCLVYGSASEYLRAATLFLGHSGGVYEAHHASDQNILQLNKDQFRQVELVPEVHDPGWDRSCAVHFANGRMREHQPRHKWIPRLRSSHAF